MIIPQAEESKRVAGIDPGEPVAVAAHSRAVESLFLVQSTEENR